MDLQLFFSIFSTVFIAELGDKTQIATLLFASDRHVSRLTVFAAASCALVLSSAMGVVAGSTLSGLVNPRLLNYIAGAGFVAIGLWTIFKA